MHHSHVRRHADAGFMIYPGRISPAVTVAVWMAGSATTAPLQSRVGEVQSDKGQ